jgi:hypothetical protein
VSPDRDHNRQRRSSKAAARRQRNSTSTSPSSSFSTPYYNYPSDSEPTHPSSSSTTLSTAASTPPTSPEPSSPTQRHTQQHQQHQQQPPKKEKRNNAPYTFEQEAFFIYHRIDLDLPWEQVRAAYMARWPGLKRTVSGLECAYYRTNANIPAVAADGLAVLVDLDVETEDGVVGVTATGVAGAGVGVGVGVGVGGSVSEVAMGGCQGQGQGPYRGSSGAENDGEEKKIGGDAWYKYYKGVAYRTRKVPCRKGRYSLMERFPEELVDERHDWVREEHRVMARGVGELLFPSRLTVFGTSLLTMTS